MLEEKPCSADFRAAVNENVRRQIYRTTIGGILTIFAVFFCTQPQPVTHSITSFSLQMLSIYFVLVNTIDSVKDRLYQNRWGKYDRR